MNAITQTDDINSLIIKLIGTQTSVWSFRKQYLKRNNIICINYIFFEWMNKMANIAFSIEIESAVDHGDCIYEKDENFLSDET